MEITVGSLVRDAREATGAAIIIDVFRAFTTAAIAFDHGASHITLVAEVEEALELRSRGIGDILMGEVDGRRPDGFDYGNSPYEVSQVGLHRPAHRPVPPAPAPSESPPPPTPTPSTWDRWPSPRPTVNAVLADAPPIRLNHRHGRPGTLPPPTRMNSAPFICATCSKDASPTPRPSAPWCSPATTPPSSSTRPRPQYHPQDVELALQISKYPFAMKVTRENGLPVARKYAP